MYFRYSTIILPTHDGFRHLSVMTPCERHADACPNGRCVNLGDDYVCDCGDGFETSMDGKSCIRKWHNGKTWRIYSVNQYLHPCEGARLGSCFKELYDGVCSDPYPQRYSLKNCCCQQYGKGWTEYRDCRLCPPYGTSKKQQQPC